MEKLKLDDLIKSGVLPPIRACKEEDGSIRVEWIFSEVRFGWCIEKHEEESGWYVVSEQITASGPLLD
jgi:hypothetical protein